MDVSTTYAETHVLRYGHNDVLWRILEPVDYTLMELGGN